MVTIDFEKGNTPIGVSREPSMADTSRWEWVGPAVWAMTS